VAVGSALRRGDRLHEHGGQLPEFRFWLRPAGDGLGGGGREFEPSVPRKRAEDVLRSGLQRFPNDAHLLNEEASLSEILRRQIQVIYLAG
jgi:hypothetical protein